jgi:hypothetical protein
MLGDFENYKNVYAISKDIATYYSPFTPISKLTIQEKSKVATVPGDNTNSIVDLEKQMEKTNDNFKGL